MLVSNLVNQFKHQSVLVTGDSYVDCEIYGDVTRLAPEAPIPVVKVNSKRSIPGGAANVAKNISLLGGQAVLYGDFGGDQGSLEVNRWLCSDERQTSSHALSATSRLPERYRIFASSQQLVQILKKPSKTQSGEVLQPLAEFVATRPAPIQALVIYDQGYGFVTEKLLQSVAALSEQYPLKVIIDGHPNHVPSYLRADLFTFNADESVAAAKQLGRVLTSPLEAGELLKERLSS